MDLGSMDTQPTPVEVTTNVLLVAAGPWHSLFLKSDGTAWASGSNSVGQLGLEVLRGSGEPPVEEPAEVLSESDQPVVFAASQPIDGPSDSQHSAFFKADGTIWTAGRNIFGQLGTGDKVDVGTAVQVFSVRCSSGPCPANSPATGGAGDPP